MLELRKGGDTNMPIDLLDQPANGPATPAIVSTAPATNTTGVPYAKKTKPSIPSGEPLPRLFERQKTGEKHRMAGGSLMGISVVVATVLCLLSIGGVVQVGFNILRSAQLIGSDLSPIPLESIDINSPMGLVIVAIGAAFNLWVTYRKSQESDKKAQELEERIRQMSVRYDEMILQKDAAAQVLRDRLQEQERRADKAELRLELATQNESKK
jgi:hypothetical protein